MILETMIFKICGMGDPVLMHQLAQLPVDMLGFIFYPRSPRYVVGKIEPAEIAKLKEEINKVGVFVNESEAAILKLANEYHLDTIQLHGNETPELCKILKENGFVVIKAFNLTKNNNYEEYSPHCDYFLFDTPSEKHGGTGAKFDWTLINDYKGKTPFLLSGGIGPDDAEELKQINHPQMAGIDINSKFEVEPGIKDLNLIKQFITPLPPKGGVGNYGIDSFAQFINETNQTFSDDSNKDHKTVKNMFYGAQPILFDLAKQLRLNPTGAEDFLWNQLSTVKIKGVRFKRQHPILYFIADFYCHRAKLVIEIDGGYHQIPSQYEYDINRDYELAEFGLKVLRFTNEEVLFNIENVLGKIEEEINQRIYK